MFGSVGCLFSDVDNRLIEAIWLPTHCVRVAIGKRRPEEHSESDSALMARRMSKCIPTVSHNQDQHMGLRRLYRREIALVIKKSAQDLNGLTKARLPAVDVAVRRVQAP